MRPPSLIPRLFLRDPAGFVAFATTVLGGAGEYATDRPSVVRFGDSQILISGTDVRPPTDSVLYLYVDDVEATYRLAIDAGARSVEAPDDTPWGDRRAIIDDGFGTTWQIATPRPQTG